MTCQFCVVLCAVTLQNLPTNLDLGKNPQEIAKKCGPTKSSSDKSGRHVFSFMLSDHGV